MTDSLSRRKLLGEMLRGRLCGYARHPLLSSASASLCGPEGYDEFRRIGNGSAISNG